MKKEQTIWQKVNGYKSKHEQGLLQSEIKELLKDYPNINMDKFNDAMMGHTCYMSDDGICYYPCDVAKAIECGVENRNLRTWEMD